MLRAALWGGVVKLNIRPWNGSINVLLKLVESSPGEDTGLFGIYKFPLDLLADLQH